MSVAAQVLDRPTADTESLVEAAIGASSSAGLSEMLKCIAEALNAFGCALWEVAPLVRSDARQRL
jgi:hypothetical protein